MSTQPADKPQVIKTRLKVAGLWANVSKHGEYWTGKTTEGIQFIVTPNGFKKTEKHPDFLLSILMPDPENAIPKNSRAVVSITEVVAPLAAAPTAEG